MTDGPIGLINHITHAMACLYGTYMPTGGVHKKEYWVHALEDILDVWAKLPEVAALVYANTYKGGKVRGYLYG